MRKLEKWFKDDAAREKIKMFHEYWVRKGYGYEKSLTLAIKEFKEMQNANTVDSFNGYDYHSHSHA